MSQSSTPKPITDQLDLSAYTPIHKLNTHQIAEIKHVDASHDDIDRLKAMGICQGRRVQLIQAGDPLILKVVGVRIGVSARLAKSVYTEPCRRTGSGC
ncbi:FeoA domain protein [Poriferisphaera corsica]|uniref:FeoA domain protein n=1 Tax=Poriferisphaera corsica TaxID=2528020 RepID=A0A517YVB9_9BACT|nr:ferrous iron transport protein A [Poriferisphaera corsica]QDU34136.1 FeoA domain protein [Poriferisphaera corsica]